MNIDFITLIKFMSDFWHGVAGGIAGITVDLVFYPLQTIKTRIMGSSLGENFTNIARSKFRGFSCQMIVSFPYSFSFFYTYEAIRSLNKESKWKNFYASILAEIVGNIVRNPFEIIKQQLIVGRSQKIRSSLVQIIRKKGFRGFYIGYQSTLARDIIFSAIQLPIYEILREKNYLELSPVANSSLSGSLAAIVAGFVSCPLDVIKTRLMTQNMQKFIDKNIVQIIYAEGGLKGFLKGVQFRCVILSFGGIIYFGALQKARLLLNIE